MITEDDLKAAFREGWEARSQTQTISEETCWKSSASAKKVVRHVVDRRVGASCLVDVIRGEIMVAMRDLTDEEWENVAYNVNRKTPGPFPSIPIWVFKEVAKYLEFESGFRARAKLANVVVDMTKAGDIEAYPHGDPMDAHLHGLVAAYIAAVNHRPGEDTDAAWKAHDDEKNKAADWVLANQIHALINQR